MNLKNIIIVGGGTAGWLSALFLKNAFNNLNITVIESEEIDVLGVGEGGIPIILKCFNDCNIDLKELFKETKATIKLGVKFKNWNADEDYYHPFPGNFLKINEIEWPDVNEGEVEDVYDEETGEKIVHEYDTNKQKEREDFYKMLKISFMNRVFNDETVDFLDYANVYPLDDTIPDFDIETIINKIGEYNNTGISIHFDSVLLGNYLKKICIERGVNYIQDTVFDVVKTEEEFVEKVITKNMDEYECDLVMDCSGQSRVITSTFSDYDIWPFPFLTVNSALTFSLPVDENLSCWTEAIAMNYGWVWKIPLQNRIGVGYVFDDRYLDFEYAKIELQTYFGQEIEVQKEISFLPGYVDKPWNRNCVAIGMSQSFVEPLEATAIGASVLQLMKLVDLLKSVAISSEEGISDVKNLDDIYLDEELYFLKQLEYNEETNNQAREIADFLLLHYYTNRDDTDFWELRKELFEFKDSIEEKESESDGIEETMTFKMMIWKKHPIFYNKNTSMIFFNEFNFMCVFDGLKIYDKAERNKLLEAEEQVVLNFCSDQNYADLKEHYKLQKETFFKNSLKQLDYLRKYELLA